METWKDIKGLEGRYQVSDQGNVKSVDRFHTRSNGVTVFYKGKVLNKRINRHTGYWQATICSRGRDIHRMMAIAFIPNPDNKGYVNHINSIRSDNTLSNLEWCTQSENLLHGFRYGNMRPTSLHGELNHNYKDGSACAGREEIRCEICGKPFIPRIVRIKTCSMTCRAKLVYQNRRKNQGLGRSI